MVRKPTPSPSPYYFSRRIIHRATIPYTRLVLSCAPPPHHHRTTKTVPWQGATRLILSWRYIMAVIRHFVPFLTLIPHDK